MVTLSIDTTVILFILFGSQNILALPQKTDNSTSLDNFGIAKIYRTKTGGVEWYVDMDNPTSDPHLTNLQDIRFVNQSDGSWQVHAIDGKVRMLVLSPLNQKWLNVEMTGYFKATETSSERDDKGSFSDKPLFQMYSRGGMHKMADPCIGSAYKARIYDNGTATWVKEVTFPAYTDQRGANMATSNPLLERWIGFKAVIYNAVGSDGKTYVRMESYIDDNVTGPNGKLMIKNNWKVASIVEDKGGWATTEDDFDPLCGVARDDILITPRGSETQNIVAWRTDDTIWNFKYLSAREIQPPR
jgi:hypothetical protein